MAFCGRRWRRMKRARTVSGRRERSTASSRISTPQIIIRLLGRSMRSHAVSTVEMRSRLVMPRSRKKFIMRKFGRDGGEDVCECPTVVLYSLRYHKPDYRRSTMSDLQAQFDAAVATSKTLTKKPGNEILLRLYA